MRRTEPKQRWKRRTLRSQSGPPVQVGSAVRVFPESLLRVPLDGSYICAEWELRITARCQQEDLRLPRDSSFADTLNHPIVQAFTRERADKTEGTRQLAPLTQSKLAWVIGQGSDHRGATYFDAANRVVWLIAYGRHRSGSDDDFFPYAKQLDADARLFPTVLDYEGLIRDRDRRFVAAVRIEGPLLFQDALQRRGEHRVILGGRLGACVAVEILGEIGEIVVAFKAETVPWTHVVVILQSIWTSPDWSQADALPSRPLNSDEVAFSCMFELALPDEN